MKVFVVLKAAERRLLLGHDLEVQVAKLAQRKLSSYDTKCLPQRKLLSKSLTNARDV
jgi:hypothetical protein